MAHSPDSITALRQHLASRQIRRARIRRTAEAAIIGAALVSAALLASGHTGAQNADCGAYAGLQQAGTWQREQSDTPEGYEDIFYPDGRQPDPALRYQGTQPVAGTLACDPFAPEAAR
jgi:hypothetical protein